MAPRTPCAAGFSLPELMIALAIGLMLIIAFITVLDRCRHEMASVESLAQLDNEARHALDVLTLDLEHAGFFGTAGGLPWRFSRNGTAVTEGEVLRQPDAAQPRAPLAGLPAGSHDCGVNFTVDLELAVEAANNSWLHAGDPRSCTPTAAAGGVHAGSDTLIIRRASLEPAEPHAGRLQLYQRRLETHAGGALFADGVTPGPLDDQAEIRDIEVRSYYIANRSVGGEDSPALRVKALTESRGAAQFRDEELVPGVEDLQVEFGVRDPSGADAKLRFVTADFPGLRAQRVVAVRFWLRIRANSTEAGYEDTRALRYSDASFVPDRTEAGQRRLLIERTVFLRNEAPT